MPSFLSLQCKHLHFGESRQQPSFEYVSQRLDHRTCQQLQDAYVALHLGIVGAMPKGARTVSAHSLSLSIPTCMSLMCVYQGGSSTSKAASAYLGPQRHPRSSSVSVEVSPSVPVPPGYRGLLRVQFFAQVNLFQWNDARPVLNRFTERTASRFPHPSWRRRHNVLHVARIRQAMERG